MKVRRDYSCDDTVSKNKLTCLYCNRSSEIITGRKEEMIKLGFGEKEIDKDGNEIVVLIK